MTNVKACELRAKLSGLLIDRVEVLGVDLRGALEAAERRVIDVAPLPLPSRGGRSTGARALQRRYLRPIQRGRSIRKFFL
jgi:hypothetical protein